MQMKLVHMDYAAQDCHRRRPSADSSVHDQRADQGEIATTDDFIFGQYVPILADEGFSITARNLLRKVAKNEILKPNKFG
jgi:hypothetical protein